MKTLLRWILLIAVLGLAACQSAAPAATSSPGQPDEAYPVPLATSADAQAYPPAQSDQEAYPPAQSGDTSGEAYPGPGADQPNQITWDGARQLILSAQVAEVFQLHDLTVTLTLKDGRVFETKEPDIDAVLDVLEECGEPCSDVAVATE